MNEPLIVTASQIAERDKWDRLHMEGKCTIDEALSMCMCIGAPVSPYLREQYERAWNRYRDEKRADLAELLGYRVSDKERRAMERMTWVSHLRFLVDSFHKQGFVKTNPSHYESTAFHKAAKVLEKKPSYVFDTYYSD